MKVKASPEDFEKISSSENESVHFSKNNSGRKDPQSSPPVDQFSPVYLTQQH